MKTQVDFLQEILALKEQNQEAEIVFVVSNSEIYGGDVETLFAIRNVELRPFYNGLIDWLDINDEIENRCIPPYDDDESYEWDAFFERTRNMTEKEVGRAICVFTVGV